MLNSACTVSSYARLGEWKPLWFLSSKPSLQCCESSGQNLSVESEQGTLICFFKHELFTKPCAHRLLSPLLVLQLCFHLLSHQWPWIGEHFPSWAPWMKIRVQEGSWVTLAIAEMLAVEADVMDMCFYEQESFQRLCCCCFCFTKTGS